MSKCLTPDLPWCWCGFAFLSSAQAHCLPCLREEQEQTHQSCSLHTPSVRTSFINYSQMQVILKHFAVCRKYSIMSRSVVFILWLMWASAHSHVLIQAWYICLPSFPFLAPKETNETEEIVMIMSLALRNWAQGVFLKGSENPVWTERYFL